MKDERASRGVQMILEMAPTSSEVFRAVEIVRPVVQPDQLRWAAVQVKVERRGSAQ